MMDIQLFSREEWSARNVYLYQIAVDCFCIFQMALESVPHVNLTVLYSINYGALRSAMMDSACTCRKPHKFMLNLIYVPLTSAVIKETLYI